MVMVDGDGDVDGRLLWLACGILEGCMADGMPGTGGYGRRRCTMAPMGEAYGDEQVP